MGFYRIENFTRSPLEVGRTVQKRLRTQLSLKVRFLPACGSREQPARAGFFPTRHVSRCPITRLDDRGSNLTCDSWNTCIPAKAILWRPHVHEKLDFFEQRSLCTYRRAFHTHPMPLVARASSRLPLRSAALGRARLSSAAFGRPRSRSSRRASTNNGTARSARSNSNAATYIA